MIDKLKIMSKEHIHLAKKSAQKKKKLIWFQSRKGGKSPSGCFCSGDNIKAQTQALPGDRRPSWHLKKALKMSVTVPLFWEKGTRGVAQWQGGSQAPRSNNPILQQKDMTNLGKGRRHPQESEASVTCSVAKPWGRSWASLKSVSSSVLNNESSEC